MIYSSDGYFRRRTAALILRPAITCCGAGEPVKDFVDLEEQTPFKGNSFEYVFVEQKFKNKSLYCGIRTK